MTTTTPERTPAECPICGRASEEETDRDLSTYNRCASEGGCQAIYVTPRGLNRPTMVLPLWEDRAWAERHAAGG